MPRISLIVVVHGDRMPLTRLITNSERCFDDLLVVHDGEDTSGVREVVESFGGRFVERARAYSQEPHFPFVFEQARYDWLLRLDSDEYPSSGLAEWIARFRADLSEPFETGGYLCVWPAWNGRRAVANWPNKRLFLFDRRKTHFVGVYEQSAIVEGKLVRLPYVLHHEPPGKSHGLRNILFKPRTVQGRRNVAQALMGSPLDHPRWRYDSHLWPAGWQQLKDHPVRTGLTRLVVYSIRHFVALIISRNWPRPSLFLHAGLFHALLGLEISRTSRREANRKAPPIT